MYGIESKERFFNGPLITVFGGTGFVGSYLSGSDLQEKFNMRFISRSDVDITNEMSPLHDTNLFPEGGIILNLAAYTQVDEAEYQKGDMTGRAWKTNVEGVKNLTNIAKERNAFLLNIGTDFEFSGDPDCSGPYTEDDVEHIESRLSWYGYTKSKGLEVLKDSGIEFAHIRISYPFGKISNQNDFMNRTLQYIEKGYPLFSDQHITPTYLPDLSNAIDIIITKRLTGVFHVATSDVTTPYEFAKKMISGRTNLKEGKLVDYLREHPDKAPRPIMGGLQVSKTELQLGTTFHRLDKALSEITA